MEPWANVVCGAPSYLAHPVASALTQKFENHLMLWKHPPVEDDLDIYPLHISTLSYAGDVTELKAPLNFLKLMWENPMLLEKFRLGINCTTLTLNTLIRTFFHRKHGSDPSPCTGFACFDEDVASIGEDGRLALLNIRQKLPVKIIDEADDSSLHCVCFLKHNEVITGNLRGQMKIWDLKSPSKTAASTFMLSGDQVCASCVVNHPTQCHLVLAGGEDGCLTVWDLRHNTFPVTLLSAHTDTASGNWGVCPPTPPLQLRNYLRATAYPTPSGSVRCFYPVS
uniref:Uncharacterized protein n=1 Tax=Timema cristinae TaxID=61476 RepID=A0A7R9H0G3_TIMCR|nr:unnamed protein product [Timema cristinae]